LSDEFYDNAEVAYKLSVKWY